MACIAVERRCFIIDNLLPIRELSPEARELLATFGMSNDEKKKLIEGISVDFTIEAAEELMVEISEPYLKENPPDDARDVRNMFLWNVRMAYLHGFTKAVDAFSSAIEIGLRSKDGDSNV